MIAALCACAAPPAATPARQSGGLPLLFDAGAGQRQISPDIYGMSVPDPALARELRLPLQRWGGNAATRYNWRNDASNRAADWFFENIPNDHPDPTRLPDGSAADQFVAQGRAIGAGVMLTIPLIGWTPKSRERTCGFAVARYGPQQRSDPTGAPCGNGLRPDGTPITGNDPHDTSIAIGPEFVQAWVRHLIERFGPAGHGGVALYSLDNEPSLWHQTHRDVHPEPVGYNELRERTIAYAAALKQADPGAQTLGPAEWGWPSYFSSARDQVAGSWPRAAPDRDAHGGMPLVPWYLQQMRTEERRRGVRLLDYLDLHYYPDAVALQPAGDAATQARRLRSTRSLWDPTYRDEGWIADRVMLLPRMRAWVNEHYPGTRLAIGEYNWGALDDINGALAQADVLGIFGREGLDLAALWSPPAPGQPGAFAFRIYRNYDGAGGAFGEASVPAASADQDRLAIYAARRAADGALTLVVINKTRMPLAADVTLRGFAPGAAAQVYRYGPADLRAIIRAPDQPLRPDGFAATFPASSITLLVLPPR